MTVADAQPIPLVELRGVTVVRGGRPVLTLDYLGVGASETVTVVGPNGAGKSTLLLALADLIRPDRGELVFGGRVVTAHDGLRYRRRIGLVLPDPLLLDTSVFNNVAAGLRFRGVGAAEIRTRVGEWLERLGVASLSARPARRISSGEAQRVSLARALVLEPELLLLDEPFASVDPATRARLLDDLEDLLEQTRVACVVVTHDLDEAVRLGDRMAVVIDGQLRQLDRPNALLAAPVDAGVAAFVGAETRLPGRILRVMEGVATIDVGGTAPIEAVSTLEAGRPVLCCLRPEDVTLWVARADASESGLGPQTGASAGSGASTGPVMIVSSARNQLRGRVRRMVPEGSLVRVTVDCGVGLVATVTRTSAVEMGLAVDALVVASFKASAVHLIPEAKEPAGNQPPPMTGKIASTSP